jgi:iron complex transport system substrate-binding protein
MRRCANMLPADEHNLTFTLNKICTFAFKMNRIVSLLPAATEIVCALGLEDTLVGRSHECDFPETVKSLPVCSEANFADNLSSLEIDNKVKELLAGALSVYTVKREAIKQLAPGIVITQAQCEVCAVSLKEVEEALNNYLDKQTRIISLQPNSLADIFNDIKHVAAVLNVIPTGDTLVEDLEERVDIIRHKLKYAESRPKVACVEWLAPLMVSGNWVPELVNIAGGSSILAEAGAHSPYVQWEAIQQQDPEVIILMPCGFPVERSIKEIGLLLELPGFAAMQAVKNNRFYIADGNQYFNRPGPRIVDSVEMLAEIIHPKLFNFGYENNGWIKFSF